jgi:hypothetical protein
MGLGSAAPFTHRGSLAELLCRWPIVRDRSAHTLCSAGILELLEAWEYLARQSEEAADTLRRHAPQVRAMLRTIGERIETGEWHTTGWNVFDVLGRVRLEDAHSDMLAWLLSPWEAHGLGVRFLMEFVLTATGRRLPNGRVHDCLTRKRLGADAGIIDIEVVGDRWVVAVENKIDAGESPGQTEGYAKHYRRFDGRGLAVFGVFLTLNGDDAEAGDIFKPLSYAQLRRILNRMQGNGDTARLICWFADNIRNNLEPD